MSHTDTLWQYAVEEWMPKVIFQTAFPFWAIERATWPRTFQSRRTMDGLQAYRNAYSEVCWPSVVAYAMEET